MKESLVVDSRSNVSPAQLDAARAAFPKVGQNLMNAEKARATAAVACLLCTVKNETCILILEYCASRYRKIITIIWKEMCVCDLYLM